MCSKQEYDATIVTIVEFMHDSSEDSRDHEEPSGIDHHFGQPLVDIRDGEPIVVW